MHSFSVGLAFTLIVLSGCTGLPAEAEVHYEDQEPATAGDGQATPSGSDSSEEPRGSAPEPEAEAQNASPPEGGAGEPAPRAEPLRFRASLLAPVPDGQVWDACGSNGGIIVNSQRDRTWTHILFGQDLGGWHFAFNQPGLVVMFPGHHDYHPPQQGTVPAGVANVYVCNWSAVAVTFDLVLTPPDREIITGHIWTPGPESFIPLGKHCHGDYVMGYQYWTEHLTTQSFRLGDQFAGWQFDLLMAGMLVDLHSSLGQQIVGTAGKIPPGDVTITVCSQRPIDAEFTIALTPPQRSL